MYNIIASVALQTAMSFATSLLFKNRGAGIPNPGVDLHAFLDMLSIELSHRVEEIFKQHQIQVDIRKISRNLTACVRRYNESLSSDALSREHLIAADNYLTSAYASFFHSYDESSLQTNWDDVSYIYKGCLLLPLLYALDLYLLDAKASLESDVASYLETTVIPRIDEYNQINTRLHTALGKAIVNEFNRVKMTFKAFVVQGKRVIEDDELGSERIYPTPALFYTANLEGLFKFSQEHRDHSNPDERNEPEELIS